MTCQRCGGRKTTPGRHCKICQRQLDQDARGKSYDYGWADDEEEQEEDDE